MVSRVVAVDNISAAIINTIPLIIFPAYIWPRPGIRNDKNAAKNGFLAIFIPPC
jgi:hypothetical protein